MPKPPYTLDDLVEDLEALRRELGIERAHFAGHSLGGMIGPAYARKYPQHVKTLGLWSTAAFRTEDDSAKVKGVVAAMRAKGIPQVLEALKDRWFTPEFAAAPAGRDRAPHAAGDRHRSGCLPLASSTSMPRPRWRPGCTRSKQPCLVLTGENDGGCNPRLNRLIAEALPRFRAGDPAGAAPRHPAGSRRPGGPAGPRLPAPTQGQGIAQVSPFIRQRRDASCRE